MLLVVDVLTLSFWAEVRRVKGSTHICPIVLLECVECLLFCRGWVGRGILFGWIVDLVIARGDREQVVGVLFLGLLP